MAAHLKASTQCFLSGAIVWPIRDILFLKCVHLGLFSFPRSRGNLYVGHLYDNRPQLPIHALFHRSTKPACDCRGLHHLQRYLHFYLYSTGPKDLYDRKQYNSQIGSRCHLFSLLASTEDLASHTVRIRQTAVSPDAKVFSVIPFIEASALRPNTGAYSHLRQ